MKRLLRVSLDTALLSFIPVLSWFMLSILVDKNLINVFTLTYPIQFIYYMFKSIFSTGANISKEKDKDKYAVGNGLFIAIILGFIIYGSLVLNIDKYITFMNMDVLIYHDFAIYSVIQLYIQLIFNFIIEKLYYEEKNKLANKYSICFNLINFVMIIITSLLFKNRVVIISLTLISIGLYTLYLFIKEHEKFNLKSNILKWVKYDSVYFFHFLCFFLIFLFGLKNVIEYGEKYTIAITFVALITDTQWDVYDAINTIAKIDIVKDKFNYKESRNNAYKLLLILLSSIFVMFLIFNHNYKLNYGITFIFLGTEVFNFLIFPIYSLKATYLNLEYSSTIITSNKMVANIARILLSLIKTPYCTAIGQIISSTYQLIILNILYKIHKRKKLK